MKKESVYELIKASLSGSKSSYLRYLTEFSKELRINGYPDMSDSITNIIESNTKVVYSSVNKSMNSSSHKNTGSFISMVKNSYELELLVQGINMGIIRSSFFFGSPGTGKTHFVNELGRLTDMPVKKMSVSEIIDYKLGESIRNLDTFFKKNISGKNIIFIDEADSLFTKRGGKNDVFEMERLLTTMLQIMDLDRNSVIIFASNLVKRIDRAILRRFDILINFDKFKIDLDKAINNSNFLNDWPISSVEKTELKKYINLIHNIRLSDVDLIARKYIISRKMAPNGIFENNNLIHSFIEAINNDRSKHE